MGDFSTLLVANRGEIAVRIMRTARELGIRTVAVYSDADATAPHVRFADDAVRLGPAPVSESYLLGHKIIEAAIASGAQAIHPGYGFLSENAGFAWACDQAGLVFVGPPIGAIDIMGDKARSKRAMIAAGVPCVPGYQGDDQSDAVLRTAAQEIGFPVMVKAAAGGGGRGMRLVHRAQDLPGALKLARSEAQNAFGSGDLIIEKAIIRPRHVEIQVFGDRHGTIIHLGERDCSVQRRHQKIIEEAPCPVMTSDLRAQMGAAAVEAARAVDYVGAGTVEFLLDQNGAFYFLEMNTRLQVEHPVTEAVTGLDLVAMQLKVAGGEPLGLRQEEVAIRGHAIEVRLYAEDPNADFLPSTGPVKLWAPPQGTGIRVDAGIVTGGEVCPFYDPMVAKIIASGSTREEARRRLIGALGRSALFGPKTNRDFLIDALGRETFAAGAATTAFIAETYGDGGFKAAGPGAEDHAVAAVLQYALAQRRSLAQALTVSRELVDWSSTGSLTSVFIYDTPDGPTTVTVRASGKDSYQAETSDGTVHITLQSFGFPAGRLSVNGRGAEVLVHEEDERTLAIATATRSFVVVNLAGGSVSEEASGGGGTVRAPMHGLLLEICVSEGEQVTKGQKLAILEAMKMQHEILAAIDGRISSVAATPNTQIAADALILEIEPAAGDKP